MRIRTPQEIKSLDDELNLFEEDDWNFLELEEYYGSNLEYYNDIRDDDFVKTRGFKGATALLVLVALTGLTIVFFFSRMYSTDMQDYKRILAVSGIGNSSKVARVEGESASSEDMIAISTLLNNYFGVVEQEADLSLLYDYCVGTSSFADTYYSTTSKISELYDDNDCYARSLKEFSKYCKPGKIHDIIINDDVYYCYLDFKYPKTQDIKDYINLYQYNVTKYFTSHDTTESNIMQFVLDTSSANPMQCSTSEYCIKVVKKDGVFKISNDSFMTSICTDAYTDTVTQITSKIGGRRIEQ